MEIRSLERETQMGAVRFSAVLVGKKFIRISELPGNYFIGKQQGFREFGIEVPKSIIWARFYRSNRGNESVVISHGPIERIQEFASFDLADRWAKGNEDDKCPVCGRPLENIAKNGE